MCQNEYEKYVCHIHVTLRDLAETPENRACLQTLWAYLKLIDDVEGEKGKWEGGRSCALCRGRPCSECPLSGPKKREYGCMTPNRADFRRTIDTNGDIRTAAINRLREIADLLIKYAEEHGGLVMKGMRRLSECGKKTEKAPPLAEGDVMVTDPLIKWRVSCLDEHTMQLIRCQKTSTSRWPRVPVARSERLTDKEARDLLHPCGPVLIRESDNLTVAQIYAEPVDCEVKVGSWVWHKDQGICYVHCAHIRGSWWLWPAGKSLAHLDLKDKGWHLILPTPEGHEALVKLFADATAGAFGEKK